MMRKRKSSVSLQLSLTIVILMASVSEPLKFYQIHVPHYKLSGEDAVLQCQFELGDDHLYAVKWYKDNEEFFRYVPRFNPPIRTHPVEGVHVHIPSSNATRVVLKSLNVSSTGVYKVEVSADAPSFPSGHDEGRLTVIYLPKTEPQITGDVQDEYKVGDVLNMTCTSSESYPQAKISWYINEMAIDVPWTENFYKSWPRENRKYRDLKVPKKSVSHLTLKLSPHHFQKYGQLEVKCVTRISTMYSPKNAPNEKTYGNSNQKIKGLEFLEAVPADQTSYGQKIVPLSDSHNAADRGFYFKKETILMLQGTGSRFFVFSVTSYLLLVTANLIIT